MTRASHGTARSTLGPHARALAHCRLQPNICLKHSKFVALYLQPGGTHSARMMYAQFDQFAFMFCSCCCFVFVFLSAMMSALSWVRSQHQKQCECFFLKGLQTNGTNNRPAKQMKNTTTSTGFLPVSSSRKFTFRRAPNVRFTLQESSSRSCFPLTHSDKSLRFGTLFLFWPHGRRET